MGNKKPVEAKKRKKKGRPSLLDLQKRSLRLQKQQQEEEQEKPSARNPNPNPYLKFPDRRSTRRNPNLVEDGEDEDGDEEEEEESNGKRKEKKLKLVSRIPNGSELGESGSDSDEGGEGSRKKRKIDAVEQTGRQNSNPKATDQALQDAIGTGDLLDSGPTTPLPDKKLLLFILDRLQKKDTYGVFLEPVDPEELPDYHDIIKHPMDFGTVRKKLDARAYENLEQFEGDVFLITSNAMRYNASDTIYFRQARTIQELAKKDFENLRQESDDDELEQKTARRGRPPIKNVMKRIARAPADCTAPNFSPDATLANSKEGIHTSNLTRDAPKKGSPFEKPNMEASIRTSHGYRGNSDSKPERNEEFSGSPLKGIPMRNWKKFSVIDENRRNTYFQPLQSTCPQEPSILTAFEGEKKSLMPIGLYIEHAYARSLARFAANLGPVGWEIAAKRMQRVLPSGTKFGPGWVGDNEAAHKLRPTPLSSSQDSSLTQPKPSRSASGMDKLSESNPLSTSAASAAPAASRPLDSAENTSTEVGPIGGARAKSPLQLPQIRPLVNGFSPGYGFSLPSQKRSAHTVSSPELSVSRNGSSSHQAPCTSIVDANEKAKSIVTDSNVGNLGSPVSDQRTSSEGQRRAQSLNPRPGSVPPDLNVDFQSPGSPASGATVDSQQQKQHQQQQQQQPDLVLQL